MRENKELFYLEFHGCEESPEYTVTLGPYARLAFQKDRWGYL